MVLTNDKQFQMRVSDEFFSVIDDWRRAQPDIPGRAEAVRRLVGRGMQADAAPKAEHSLLSKLREFIIDSATMDLPEDEQQHALILAPKVAALPDDELMQAIYRLIEGLESMVLKREKRVAPKKPRSRA